LPRWQWQDGAAGVHEQGKGTVGLPRNLGDPNCSTGKDGEWLANGWTVNIQACTGPTSWGRAGDTKKVVRSVVPPNEGNEVRRDGIRES